jgi:hypothetical protein
MWKTETDRIVVTGWLGQKNLGDLPSQWKKAGRKHKIGGLQSRLAWTKSKTLPQNSQSKKG